MSPNSHWRPEATCFRLASAVLTGCIVTDKPFAGLAVQMKPAQASASVVEVVQDELKALGYVRVDRTTHRSSVEGEASTYFFQRDGVQCAFTVANGKAVGDRSPGFGAGA